MAGMPPHDKDALASSLTANTLSSLVVESTDWASAHGLLVAPRDTNRGMHARGRKFAVAPVTLVPSATPKQAFDEAYALQPLINRLTDAITRDHAFLEAALSRTTTADPFTGRLWQLYTTTRSAKPNHYEVTPLPVHRGARRSVVACWTAGYMSGFRRG